MKGIRQKKVVKVISDVADKHGLTHSTVNDIYFNFFKYAKELIESGIEGNSNTMHDLRVDMNFGFMFNNQKYRRKTNAKRMWIDKRIQMWRVHNNKELFLARNHNFSIIYLNKIKDERDKKGNNK